MAEMMIFGPDRFLLEPSREEVFSWLMCTEELPCYRAFDTEWEAAVALLHACISPYAAFVRESENSMTVFITLGPQAEAEITRLFEAQHYVAASLLNTLCDEMLFQMDRQAAAIMEDVLAPEGLHIAARMEPVVDLAPDDLSRLSRPLLDAFPDVRVTRQGMLFPTKSMMYCVSLSSTACDNEALHDCSRCSQTNCLYRTVRQS